jgi:hypothetical protein
MRDKSSQFDNVRDQIGRCGLWCGSCGVGNGALALVAKRLLEIYDGYDVSAWGPKDFDVEEFRKGLRSLSAMEGCRGCLEGGGNPECKMRPCAESKSIGDCTECEEQADCPNRKILDHYHCGAQAVGMIIKTEKEGNETFIETRMDALKRSWPACILFVESTLKKEQDT